MVWLGAFEDPKGRWGMSDACVCFLCFAF